MPALALEKCSFTWVDRIGRLYYLNDQRLAVRGDPQQLAAWCFTVLMTLNLWGINPKLWMTGYLEACIANGRKPPDDLSQWVPWQMSESRLNELRTHDSPAE